MEKAEMNIKEKQMMTNEQLESELKFLRNKERLSKILTYGSGAAMILTFMVGIVPLAVILLIVALVSGYQLSKNSSTIKKLLGDHIVGNVLNEVFNNVDYNPFGKIESVSSAGMVFPFSFEKVTGNDHVKANYKGLKIELSDIELYHVEDYYDDEKDRWEEHEQKVFEGQWLICDFGKELSGEVHLSKNTKKLRKQHKNDSVEMGNPEFNNQFLVTAPNKQEAHYILTPSMMKYILTIADKSSGDIYFSFLRDGKLHIAVQTGHDFFELGKTEANIDKLRQKFLNELQWFTDIVDELRLESSLYEDTTNS